MTKPLPDISIPVVGADGSMTLEWYRYFQGRERVGLSNFPDVKIISLSNGEVLIWNSADNKWENGSN